MAQNESSTVGSVISGISPALSAIPYVGSILSMLGTTVGGALQQRGAQQQAEQAAKARKAALNKGVDAMRPEYLKKLQMDKMNALSDVAGIDFAKKQLEAQTANQLRAIRESSPSGTATVNAISAALGQRNSDEQKLAVQNLEHKQKALGQVSSDLEMLGNKGMALEERRDQWKREGLQAASALENAATANKMTAASTIIGGLTSGLSSIGKTAQNQWYVKALSNAYADKNAAPTVDGTTPQTDLSPTEDASLTTPNAENVSNLSLSKGEQFDLINKIVQSGKAKDQTEALQLLRQMGYNI